MGNLTTLLSTVHSIKSPNNNLLVVTLVTPVAVVAGQQLPTTSGHQMVASTWNFTHTLMMRLLATKMKLKNVDSTLVPHPTLIALRVTLINSKLTSEVVQSLLLSVSVMTSCTTVQACSLVAALRASTTVWLPLVTVSMTKVWNTPSSETHGVPSGVSPATSRSRLVLTIQRVVSATCTCIQTTQLWLEKEQLVE